MIDSLRSWRHVFKLDPDKPLSEEALERICLSGSDALMVGGSTGVTYANTQELLNRIRRYDMPCALEISNREAIVPGFDFYFIPVVLNTSDREWIIGHHHQALKDYGAVMPWERIAAEGYVITNPQSAVARLCSAHSELSEQDLIAYASMAEKLFQFPVFYLENSGAFGNMEELKKVASVLSRTRLFYGGGIDDADKAAAAAEAADTIVVGNCIYDNIEAALSTVSAIKTEILE